MQSYGLIGLLYCMILWCFIRSSFLFAADRPHIEYSIPGRDMTSCSLRFSFLTPAQEPANSALKMQFSAATLPPTLLLQLSCRRGERCELHQARLSQLEPLIITSQYQLQQPCADAKTLRGLATLPYLI